MMMIMMMINIIIATFLILQIIAPGSKAFLSTCSTSNDPRILTRSVLKQHGPHMLLKMTKFKRNCHKLVIHKHKTVRL